MNKVFAGVSCLLFTSLDPRFESRFHAKDNIYDTASSGYNTILGDEYKAFSSLLCNLLHSPVISCLLGPNILLNTMFSNILSFLSSCSVNDQVSHPYKTTGKITVLYSYLKLQVQKHLSGNKEKLLIVNFISALV